MNKIIYLLFAVGLISCNSPLDKSVFKPLTVEDLKQSIDKDSLFKNTYEYIVYVRDTVMKSDLEKVKFADLTYEQIHEFALFSADTTYFKPINERIEKEWTEKYGIYREQVDSVSNYWKKFKKENSIEQYVKIELVEIDKEYYSYNNGVRNVNLGFRLTPLKGKIEQVRFGYSIEAKINEKENGDIYSSLDKNWCRSTSPFSRPIVRYWEADYTNEKILKNKTIKTFLRDYNIHIEVDKMRKDGKNMSNDDLNIPKALENHWKYENKERYLKDIYFDDVVKDVLNKEYMPNYEYRSQEIDKILKENYPLTFEFVRLPQNKE
jgi:hypothetical protein